MDRDSYEYSRLKSVNRSQEQEQLRQIVYSKKDMRDARRESFAKGAKAGLKRGFATGAIIAILAYSGFSLGKNAIMTAINTNYDNPSVDAGYHAVSEETFRTQDNQGYWYSYYDIAKSYDADTMDFDAFVYGNYKNVGWNEASKLSCMDELFRQFNMCGITDCSSFLSYCEGKGVCKEVDGQMQVDTKAYESAVRDYLASLNEVQELEDNIDGFRHGK